MELADFWKSANRLSRVALAAAALSAVILLGAFVGLSLDRLGAITYVMHLAVLALLLLLFARVAWHHFTDARRPNAEHSARPVPRSLKRLAVAAIALFVILLVTTAVAYGDGGPELQAGQYVWTRHGRIVRTMTADEHQAFQSSMLRVFASAWLAFSLMVAWVAEGIRRRA